MRDLPLAVLVPVIVLAVGAWTALFVDMLRAPHLTRKARLVWTGAFLVLWILAPLTWALVKLRLELKVRLGED